MPHLNATQLWEIVIVASVGWLIAFPLFLVGKALWNTAFPPRGR